MKFRHFWSEVRALQAKLKSGKSTQIQTIQTLKQIQKRNQLLEYNNYCKTESTALTWAPAAMSAASASVFPIFAAA